jgi:hypothetical protein
MYGYTGPSPPENNFSSVFCKGENGNFDVRPKPCYLWVAQYGSYQVGWGCDAAHTMPKYQQTEKTCYWFEYGQVSGGDSAAGGGSQGCAAKGCLSCRLPQNGVPALHLLCSHCLHALLAVMCCALGLATSTCIPC